MRSVGLHHFPLWWSPAEQERAVSLSREICKEAPLRRPKTPGGKDMRVRITNAGICGWWSDEKGYRYIDEQPDGRPWPQAPQWILHQAQIVARRAGVEYEPDSILLNLYEQDTFLSRHVDESEADLCAPVVSFSLGAAAVFHLRGEVRESPIHSKTILESGDALVMIPPARNWYHSIAQILDEAPLFSPLSGSSRLSILVRKAK